MEVQTKSLDRWRFEIKSRGKSVWPQFYQAMMGVKVSDYGRFYRALENYGDWPMFEAILASADKDLTGDPLPYVSKVAHEKWKEQQQERDADTEYLEAIKAARQQTLEENNRLLAKLNKAQKVTEKPKKRGTNVS